MLSSSSITGNLSARVMWKPAAIGILAVWKQGQKCFHIFLRSKSLYRRDTIANIHFEQVVTDTIYLFSAPLGQMSIETTTEVEVAVSSTSPEAIAQYQEKMDEVDAIFEVIAAVEEEYWGDIFM
ncbi:hypothetical protein GSI_11968 [Ganoderma sinense ZZ0214-1]|uniref:Uncharacterized protein n=1 Tax=Ganoderma sinense ZZ0214-1 TaxID=1077348 RepID=A0A2G8RXH5_9APHY|nr:hypothetical protein GSI_11968 [Ganoderma sinense ZZ0214-1]